MEKKQWIPHDEMMNITVAAEFTPVDFEGFFTHD